MKSAGQAMKEGSASRFRGYAIVDNLMKRWRLLGSGLEPSTIDNGWEDSQHHLWRSVSTEALGDAIPYLGATRAQLFAMAKVLVVKLDQMKQREDHWPMGWAEDAATIRGAAGGTP